MAKHVVIFCDNEGAKGAILKGYTPSKWLHDIACKIAAAEEAASLFIWYSRVPSESNPAYDLSREVPLANWWLGIIREACAAACAPE